MKLDPYRKKRDEASTNEPFGDEPQREGTTYRGAFVIHQHDATRMHYDLRLEMGGVLASFAVPRGISLDPADKHLAVHTEDHPIEYLDFEAVIPDGNYGAGPMIVWDSGVVRYLDTSAEEGDRAGKIHFSLEGKKVRGRFELIRLKPKDKKGEKREGSGKDWLLFKKTDAFAAVGRNLPEELPRSVLSGLTVTELLDSERIGKEIEVRAKKLGKPRGSLEAKKLSPMLCSLNPLPLGKDWIYELKLDGVRIIAIKDERNVELYYRSKRAAHQAYPEVARAVASLPVPYVVLDGEIVAFDERGRPDFDRLASRIQGDRRFDMRAALHETPVTFIAFDLLAVGDTDLRGAPLIERKKLLADLIRGVGILRVLDHLDHGGEELFAFCRANGLEGVVSKRAQSRYTEGPNRSGDWVKTKCEREASFVVVGYTRGENARARLGALDLASFAGDKLVVRGKAGSGLTDGVIDQLLPQLEALKVPTAVAEGTFDSAPLGRTFVRGEIVVRIRYLEWSDNGHLRFPVFLQVEKGADVRACVASPQDAEESDEMVGAILDAAPPPETDDGPQSGAVHGAATSSSAKVEAKVTNRSKLFFPDDGFTKGDLIDYYDAISPVMLEYLVDRPVMLVRYPDGIDGKNFYQWNIPHGCPPWVKSVVLGKHMLSPDGDEAHKKHVFLIDRRESLIYIANLACIPVHILASRIVSPRESDFLTIDFDVGLSSLEEAIPQAQTLRSILGEVGLTGFPKTSGQSGLHVFVTLGKGVVPEAARMLADLLGRLIVERHPKTATMERIVAKRGKKVYVDTGQTGPSRTIVAPYSVRATRGAKVSAPLAWEEVVSGLDPSRFTIKTMGARLEEVGDLYQGLFDDRPEMEKVMAKLAGLLQSAR